MPKRRRIAEPNGVWIGRDGVTDDTELAVELCKTFFMCCGQDTRTLAADLEQYAHDSRVAVAVRRVETMQQEVADVERAFMSPVRSLAPDAATEARLASACEGVCECVRECVWVRGASVLRRLLS